MSKLFKAGVVSVAAGLTFGSLPVLTNVAHADSKTVTVGVVGTSDNDLWKVVAKTAKKKYGITIKTKVFTDYTQPNQAVASGSIDLNAFQHVYFLDNWNASNKNSVVSIGKTVIAPIRLYSTTRKSVKDFKKGDTIVIPNDATNEGRALTLLQTAGLIKLNPKAKLPTPKDITSNKLNLKITAVDASQTPSALKSSDGAVINNTYSEDAKISNKEAIYTEPVNKASSQWINLIAAKKSQKNNKVYREVVKAYQTQATKNYIKKTYGNSEVAAWDIKLK